MQSIVQINLTQYSLRSNSVVVLAGELLREAEKLVNQRIHPMTIIDGFRKAAAIGRAALEASAIDNSVWPKIYVLSLLHYRETVTS